MSELEFSVGLSWSGTGREGAGHICGEDIEVDWSVPAGMGGRGEGTNPEELLVSAVASCFSATLLGVLRRAGLPVTGLRTAATGAVTGYPIRARFASLVVSPTIVGADSERTEEYASAAQAARDRCFIGHTLRPEIEYRVGSVALEPAEVPAC